MIKLLLIDDHDFIHNTFKAQFKENEKIKLIGQGYDGSELLTLYEKLKPNVVIIDIQMSSHGNGVLAIMNLMEKYPEAKVIVLSSYLHQLHIQILKGLNILGFVKKGSCWQDHIEAIKCVSQNKPYYCNSCLKMIANYKRHKVLLESLSHREAIVVAQLIHNNLKLKNIAYAMDIGYETVRTYRKRAFKKLNIKTIDELTLLAAKHGFYQGQ